MKVAIVHDWLVVSAGAEKVLKNIIECFPNADIFSIVDFLEDRECVKGKSVNTSFIQRLPFARRKYRAYLPLMPIAIEQLDLSSYDLVISSSHAVAKGVLTGPNQVHISYVHSPIRYAWDLQHQYLRESNLNTGLRSAMARVLLHYIRGWDSRSANGVDHLVANSQFIARRIKKAYQRDATVIYPPVDLAKMTVGTQKDDFYVTASRMVPYKRIDLIVQAFSKTPERKLVVIGDGPEMKRIKSVAGPNVEILGHQPSDVLVDHLRRARAFVFAAEEDFGISVVEAQACGTPVIAFGRGGALESVIGLPLERPTGVFFGEQTTESLLEAVGRFEANAGLFDPRQCRKNAERFSTENFKKALMSFVDTRLPYAGVEQYLPYVDHGPASVDARHLADVTP
ncbi:glycosyltransferase family 4 protein [Paraburkholderia sp. MMS20-SJTR3]|uniref:Glycosyltransferase family 4 protein n=1 Tax=Paraburkholderia sejongensis TaxID=2886946 RepID=A0ABS8K2R3_9BURK|nr:glycosyltransferase family 4 protein [Paraburkholderia sp. MMS20-SJTR3]MCC8396189.1 glycosyltransferase family 4 protein [Paraburkholderia sp. MMS20-SJTR3]